MACSNSNSATMRVRSEAWWATPENRATNVHLRVALIAEGTAVNSLLHSRRNWFGQCFHWMPAGA